ncbi:MAG: ABC transporter permease, partial [Actinomycetota bacterium]|nr:ABC transporter permease [Actinomycetota bacterium]
MDGSVVDADARSAIGSAMRRNKLMTVGAAAALMISVLGLLAPLLAPYAPDAALPTQTLLAPSAVHWFGTDQLGRDVLSRILYGARVSPMIALLVLFLACVVGVPLGIAAGYFRGAIDDVIMRITDVFLAFPALLLALAIAAVLPPSIGSVTFAIAITWWPWYTRLIRGQAASVSRRPYVEGARAAGVSHTRILFRHVLPNSLTPLIVQVSLDVSAVILTVSALSF